jgi:predicted ABC-type ATPase
MNQSTPQNIIVLAGPNGAGKSTTAPGLLKGALDVTEFVNADTLARGLSAFDPGNSALAAGKIMLRRLRELASQRVNFAFETTLSGRLLAPWLAGLCETGYRVHLLFLWLSSADFAVKRVAERVRMGGHDIPEDTIRRRYYTGLRNFFELYQPLTTTWRMYDNSSSDGPRLIACGEKTKTVQVYDKELWSKIRREYNHEKKHEKE